MNLKKYNEYRKAFSEIDFIMKNSTDEVKNKIPERFKKIIEKNKDYEYKININLNSKLSECDLHPKTKDLMYLIYRDYLCDDEQRETLIEEEKIGLEKLNEKYNVDNIFKNKNIYTEERKEKLPMKIEKQRWYKKIFEKIKSVFHRKNNQN